LYKPTCPHRFLSLFVPLPLHFSPPLPSLVLNKLPHFDGEEKSCGEERGMEEAALKLTVLGVYSKAKILIS
jgi:hypothetical protein